MIFSAKDSASGVMGKIAQNMQSMTGQTSAAGQAIQKNFAQFNLGMKTVGLGADILSGAFSLANLSGEFNKGVATVGALSQATADELKLLHDAAIDAGIATQFAPTEAIGGLEQLAQAGYNATESTKLLIPTLDLAAGGGISVADAAAAMSAAVKVFNLDTDQAAIATDKLLKVSNATSLSAGDLQLALGNVARGAVATQQSLDEMLPAMGLVKNTGVAASVASSSVSSALLSIADKAGKFKSDLGVSVTDAAGNFRPLMDIVLETDTALSKKFPNAADRAGKAMELFGKFGLTAFSGISAQLKGGISGSGGQKVFGAEAVADLRKQMGNAAGAAAEFRDKILNTFEGQKTLLRGSMQTMGILLGEPFERALKPVVTFVLDMFNQVLGAVKAMPDGMKDFIAKLVLGAGVLITLVGGLVAAKASLAMFAYGLSAIGVSVGGVVATLLPALLVIGAIVGAIYAFKYAVDNNLGGMGGQWGKVTTAIFNVKLAFEALQQLFTEGGLSGDVLTAYLGGEGAVNFAIRLYVVFNRIWEFFSAFGSGVLEVFNNMDGTFTRLGEAVDGLLNLFGGLGDAVDVDANAEAFDRWGQAGFAAGEFIGEAIDTIVNALAAGIEFVTGFVENFGAITDAGAEFKPVFEEVGNLIMSVLSDLGLLDEGTDGAAGGWRRFGSAVASALGFIISTVRPVVETAVSILRGLVTSLSGVIDIVAGLFTGNWERVWRGFKKVVAGAVQSVIGMLSPLVEFLASVVDGLGAIAGKKLGLADQVKKDFASMKEGMADWADFSNGTNKVGKVAPDAAPGETMPKDLVDFYTLPESPYAPTYDNVLNAEAESAGQGQVDTETLNATIQDLASAKSGEVHLSGNLVVDGDQLGTFVANGQASAAKRGGRPGATR